MRLPIRLRAFALPSVVLFAVLAGACGSADETSVDGTAGAMTGSSEDPLGQGWTAEQVSRYEHAPDGSGLFPYAWLLALEQPDSTRMFLEDDNVRRLDFIPSPKSAENPDGLPVGLVRRPQGDKVGTSCAACHEAELTFRGKTMRVHGGQGRAQLTSFFVTAYKTLLLQLVDLPKFGRFAKRVNGGKDLSVADLALFLDTVKTTAETALTILTGEVEVLGVPDVEAGPFRDDAVGIGVNVLAGPIKKENYRRANAPVSTPHLWDTPRFDWVEYNGAFQQPMTRNIISTLARGADIAFVDDGKPGLPNSVDLVRLHETETNLASLHAPKWPEAILGPIDGDKASRGRAIYFDKAKCAACHNPTAGQDGLLHITMVPLDQIGTDPKQARNWAERTVDMDGRFGLGVIPVTDFARFATQGVLDRDYSDLGVSPARQAEMNGFRPNGWRAPLAYRARPLEGTWATGPYLHNGSVPSLAQLLLPAERRVATFHLGSTEIDPTNVGLETSGEFLFDTRVDGNRNTGHTGPQYGTDLSDADRSDLLEYLKTL
jgi:mono/diheme cytochrome c family protein